jgi:hypothetical protein
MPTKSKNKAKSKKTRSSATQKVTQKQTNKQVVQVAVGDANFSRFRPQNFKHIPVRGAYMNSPSNFPYAYSSTTIVNPSSAPPINNNNIDIVGLTNRQNALEQAHKNYEREMQELSVLSRMNRDTITSLQGTSSKGETPFKPHSTGEGGRHGTVGSVPQPQPNSPTPQAAVHTNESMSTSVPQSVPFNDVSMQSNPLYESSVGGFAGNQPNSPRPFDAERMFSYLNGITNQPPSPASTYMSDASSRSSASVGVKIKPQHVADREMDTINLKRERPSSLASSGIPSINESIKNKRPPPPPPPSNKGEAGPSRQRAPSSLLSSASRQSSMGSASTGFDDPSNDVRDVLNLPPIPSSHGSLRSSQSHTDEPYVVKKKKTIVKKAVPKPRK